MNFTANNKREFLENFYLKSKRSVAKATAEGPAAWVDSRRRSASCRRRKSDGAAANPRCRDSEDYW